MREPSTLVELLLANARDIAEAPAVRLWQPRSASEDVTWAELWRGARGAALHLRKHGVGPGDRVLLILPTCRAFFEQFLGALMLHAIPVPLAPPYSLSSSHLAAYNESICSVVLNCRPRATVSLLKLQLLLRGPLAAADPTVAVLAPEHVDGPLDHVAADPTETAMLQYTSGSTSAPKGVELSHANILANASAIRRALDGRPERDVTVSWLPLYHDMGLIGTVLTSFLARVPLVLLSPQTFVKDPASWLKVISEQRGTISVAPNFAFGYASSRVDDDDLAGVRLDSLRVLLNGAEPIDLAAVDRFETRFSPYGLAPNVVRPVYGLAESALAVTFTPPGPLIRETIAADQLERASSPHPERHVRRDVSRPRLRENRRELTIVSVGTPIETQQIQIVDADDRALPERQIGEIVVRGPSVMKGYFGNADATAHALRNGWLHTGDWGFIASGNLFVTGRKKDLIIRNGRNYYPQDIELQAYKADGVRKGSAVAFATEQAGDAKLVVVVESTRDAAEHARIAAHVQDHVFTALLFRPDEVCVLPKGSVPKTTSGKVRRQECRRLYLEGQLGVKRSRHLAMVASLASSGVAYVRSLVGRPRHPTVSVEEK